MRILKPLAAELREVGKHIADRNGIEPDETTVEVLALAAVVEWYFQNHGADFTKTHNDEQYYVFEGTAEAPPIEITKGGLYRSEEWIGDGEIEQFLGDSEDASRSTDGVDTVATIGNEDDEIVSFDT
jgi:hypothetical protein